MAVFVEANPPEILRAAQKDESYINTIKSELADIVQRLFGKHKLLWELPASENMTFSLFAFIMHNRESDVVEGPVAIWPFVCLPLLHPDHTSG